MNYIQRLQAESELLRKSMLDLERYVTTEKFAVPNDYVQTADIVLRIRETFSALAELQY